MKVDKPLLYLVVIILSGLTVGILTSIDNLPRLPVATSAPPSSEDPITIIPSPVLTSPQVENIIPTDEIEADGTPILINQLMGHSKRVSSVAISPDGNVIASASRDGTVRLRAITSPDAQIVLTHGSGEGVTDVAFNPQGNTLASVTGVGVYLWDLTDVGAEPTIFHGSPSLNTVAFSPDGMQIVTGSTQSIIEVWDVSKASSIASFEGHTDIIYEIEFSPDGSTFASASGDKSIKLWDAATQTAIMTLQGHKDQVAGITYSPDGQFLASSSSDGSIQVWDIENQQSLYSMIHSESESENISDVDYSPDGRMLVSVSAPSENTIRFWNPLKRELLYEIHLGTPIFSGAFSPDGRFYVAGGVDGIIRIWEFPK